MAVRLLALFGILALSMVPGSAAAQAARAVDLELALAVDVSGSIDPHEAELQRNGYIAAFRHPDVIRAISNGILGRIAVAYYEWAGFGHMRVIVDWTIIGGAESAHAFADALTKNPPQTARRTAIADAINFAVPYFSKNDIEGTRRVIDVSGDGPNNWGGSVKVARDAAVAAGVTINGLPIINNRPSPFGWPSMPNLDLYYRDCVIGGPGAFIVVANNFKDFARAVRKKLILEIAGLTPDDPLAARPPRAVVHHVADRAAPPCDAGERRWRGDDDF